MRTYFPQTATHTHTQNTTQKNPSPPTLKAHLKLHKPNIPIRPVVNNRAAPSFKIAKKLNKILIQPLNLGNSYTVENSTKLVNYLANIMLKDSYRLNSLDIKTYTSTSRSKRPSRLPDLSYSNIKTELSRTNLLSFRSNTKPELLHLPEPNLPTHQRSSHGFPHLGTHNRNTPTIARTHAHQTPTRHITVGRVAQSV